MSNIIQPSRREPSLLLAHGAMLAVSVFYALNYYIMKGVLEFVAPFALLGIRIGSGLLFFGLISWGKIRFDRKDWLRLVACATFGVATNQLFFIWGMSKTNPVNAGVIMTLTPVLVLLIAWFMKEEKMTLFRITGMLIAFGGALLLSLKGRDLSIGGEGLLGDLFIFTNATSYALYLVLVKPLVAKYKPMPLFAALFGIGSLIALPIATPHILATDFQALSISVIAGLVYIVIFVTILAYTFNAWALRRVPSSQVGVYIYLQPMLVALLSPWLLDGTLTLWQWVWIGMVLAGVMLVNRNGKKN